MKKTLMVVGLLILFTVGGVMIVRATSGTPEIDRANANMSFQGALRANSCVGEDDHNYLTYHGVWNGNVAQVLPDATNYNLSGAATVSPVVWSINTATQRGTLTGTISLMNSAGATVFKGPLVLVTQGMPAPGGAPVPGRGYISALFTGPDETGPGTPDDSLIANVEFSLSLTGATGQFGDAASGGTKGYPDFSVVTNVAPRAQDGVC